MNYLWITSWHSLGLRMKNTKNARERRGRLLHCVRKDREWEYAKTNFQYVFAYYVLERPDLVEQLGTPTRSGSIYIITIATVANFCVGNTFG
jgi:hypothetical protein